MDHEIHSSSEENEAYSREYLFSDVRKRKNLEEEQRKKEELILEPGYADTSSMIFVKRGDTRTI